MVPHGLAIGIGKLLQELSHLPLFVSKKSVQAAAITATHSLRSASGRPSSVIRPAASMAVCHYLPCLKTPLVRTLRRPIVQPFRYRV